MAEFRFDMGVYCIQHCCRNFHLLARSSPKGEQDKRVSIGMFQGEISRPDGSFNSSLVLMFLISFPQVVGFDSGLVNWVRPYFAETPALLIAH